MHRKHVSEIWNGFSKVTFYLTMTQKINTQLQQILP